MNLTFRTLTCSICKRKHRTRIPNAPTCWRQSCVDEHDARKKEQQAREERRALEAEMKARVKAKARARRLIRECRVCHELFEGVPGIKCFTGDPLNKINKHTVNVCPRCQVLIEKRRPLLRQAYAKARNIPSKELNLPPSKPFESAACPCCKKTFNKAQELGRHLKVR